MSEPAAAQTILVVFADADSDPGTFQQRLLDFLATGLERFGVAAIDIRCPANAARRLDHGQRANS